MDASSRMPAVAVAAVPVPEEVKERFLPSISTPYHFSRRSTIGTEADASLGVIRVVKAANALE